MAALSVVVEEVFHYYVLLVAPALRRPRTRGVQLAAAQLATFWTSSNEGGGIVLYFLPPPRLGFAIISTRLSSLPFSLLPSPYRQWAVV